MNYPLPNKRITFFIKSVAVPLLTGVLSYFLTRNSMQVFDSMNKPLLSPPAIVFPIVWTVIYILMGIGFYLVVTSGGNEKDIQKAIRVYGLQLVVNFLWPTFFFNFQWYFFSFIWLLLLWVLVLIMLIRFGKISKIG